MRLEYQLDHNLNFKYRDSLDYPLHAHGEVELALMCAGSCRAVCGSAAVTLGAGDALVVFPDQPHSYEDSRDVEAYVLIVPVKQYLSPYYQILTGNLPEHPVAKADGGLLELAGTAYRDLHNVREEVMQGYLTVIFGKLLDQLILRHQTQGAEGSLRRVLAYLNAHYREEFSRKDIARAVGYNESYVSHLFSQTMHTTIPEYIHMLRIEDACRMLLQTNQTVTQVASNLGFASIRNFNRVFRRQTGMTPRQFRAEGMNRL